MWCSITVARGADAMRDSLAARPWITPIVMDAAHDLPAAFRQLRQLGVPRLSCIGGRTLASQLIEAGLIQDVYLTTSARSGGEPDTPFLAARHSHGRAWSYKSTAPGADRRRRLLSI